MELNEVVAEERCFGPKMGSVVIYVHKVDDSPEPVPNVSPAMVTKVNADNSLNLVVFFYSGTFFVHNVVKGCAEYRGTWHK